MCVSIPLHDYATITLRCTFLRSGRHHPLVPPCIIRLNLSKNKLSTSEVSELLDVGKERQFSLQNLLLQHNIIDKVPFSLVQHSELREVQVREIMLVRSA